MSYIAIQFGEKNNNNESEVIQKYAIIRSLELICIALSATLGTLCNEVCEQSYCPPAQTNQICVTAISVVRSRDATCCLIRKKKII